MRLGAPCTDSRLRSARPIAIIQEPMQSMQSLYNCVNFDVGRSCLVFVLGRSESSGDSGGGGGVGLQYK